MSPRALRAGLALAFVAQALGCASLDLEPSDPPIVAIFDPDESDIPMPNDALRDDVAGRLDLPLDDDDLTDADREFRTFLNTLDGWSSAMQATVSFSGAVDSDSIDASTVQIYRWGATPERVTDVTVELEEQDTELVITPPREGWELGARYTVVVRGGVSGVQDLRGRGIAADAAFYYLRLQERLDLPENQRAFPGDTRAERLETAADLEEIRQELAPYFDFFEGRATDPIPRNEVASLWSFTVTKHSELAMDRPSQRVPLPWDALIDPDTGLVELLPATWDDDLEADAKNQANELDGFAVSSNLMFEFTTGVDPTTVNAATVVFYEIGGASPRIIPSTFRVMNEAGEGACLAVPFATDCRHVSVVPDPMELPLDGGRTYAVIVTRDVRAFDGGPVLPMPIGHFMKAVHPIAVDGVSQIGAVSDEDATRLEGVRLEIAPLLDQVGRDDLVTAWPFTTLTVDDELRRYSNLAYEMGTNARPENMQELTVLEAVQTLFPGALIGGAVALVYANRLDGVDHAVQGTIPMPYFLGQDRRFRPDDAYDMVDVPFMLTVPEGVTPGAEVPLVIFTHGVVVDSRWVLMIAGEFARRGYAMIAIDLPFHGSRITCVERSLLAIPNFLPPVLRGTNPVLQDDLLQFAPCASGSTATCSADGQCLTAAGEPDDFTEVPIVDVKPASGAAFLDVEDIPYIKDHFLQALADMSGLHRAVFTADWTSAGITFDLDRVHYAGWSLGSIMGAVWVPYVQGIQRSALNVVGADMVDLFSESTFFGPQIDAFFARRGIAEGSFEQERLLNVARWLIDSIDPHTVAHHWAERSIPGIAQIDTGGTSGDFIIPNAASEPFLRVSGIPTTEYDSYLHMDLIIPGTLFVGDDMLTEMAAFIDGP